MLTLYLGYNCDKRDDREQLMELDREPCGDLTPGC